MWKYFVMPVCASAILLLAAEPVGARATSGALFPGYLPFENVRASRPEADNRPNDIYSHITVRRPSLREGNIVLYPQFFGFDQGKDSENKVYEIHSIAGLLSNKVFPDDQQEDV